MIYIFRHCSTLLLIGGYPGVVTIIPELYAVVEKAKFQTKKSLMHSCQLPIKKTFPLRIFSIFEISVINLFY